MKILELAPYVFIEGHQNGSRNKSGLAYMIRSICDMLASKNEVRVLTQSILTCEQKVDGWTLLKRTKGTIIKHVKCHYIKLALKLYSKDKSVGLPRRLLYCLSAGQAEDYIKTWHPDVVHIHGIGAYTLPFYIAASRCHVPIVSTLHGLISFHSIVPASESAKKLEKAFLQMCTQNGYTMTFISSGMKQKVEEWRGNVCDNIAVIPNCFRSISQESEKQQDVNLIKLICVGSVYPLKNQIQAIKVLPIVQKHFGNNKSVTLDIYGDGPSLNEWKKYTDDNGICGVVFHGRKPQIEVFAALSQANLLIFPSIEEGFGIPIIEAYSCGTPVVTFRDLDAAADIKNDDCCVFAKDRSDDAFSKAIIDGIEHEWDKEKIKSFSQSFSLEATAHKYCEVMCQKHKVWNVKDLVVLYD